MKTFQEGETLTAQDLNDALASADDDAQSLITRMNNNEIRINGAWYRQSGVMSFPQGAFTSAGGNVWHRSATVTRPFQPPSGWEFEYFVMGTAAVTVAQKSATNSITDEIRVIQIGWDFAGAPTRLGWRLIKS
ncbi:hypothetical protein [Trueperella pyogenes]|uniref:hypothetical protein n=1 Tax=Trueperella pyogenes TaxID=1661 RepID=UPI000F8564BF|nr:hypothetical protein [Trueperella pyogenes]AZR03318.1 hypothetical protein EB775_08400 [Trueperella pyogenes]WHU59290.1 hypothetical protein QEV21_01275 [Trueperella pyogenes]